MQRALHLLDQISDVVQVESGSSASEVTSLDDKSLSRLRPRRICQTSTKCVIDHIAKGASSPTGHRLQLGGHIIIERQGRAHIMMLHVEHHDVQRPTAARRESVWAGADPRTMRIECEPSFRRVSLTRQTISNQPSVIPEAVRPTIHPFGFKNADFRDGLRAHVR
jgi:hypothetical protein